MRIGCDLVLIDRIEKAVSSQHFLERVFHPKEIEYCNALKATGSRSASLAARFAAKEAFAKALGTGLFVGGVTPSSVWIENDPHGKPVLHFEAIVLEKLHQSGFRTSDVSLSHQGDYALATVILA